MRYMVMECHPGYAVVLSEDGRFLKVANMHYEVGQRVADVMELSLPQVTDQPEKKRSRRWISSIVAVAACLVMVLTSVFFVNQMPYASVYLTINPQVRIDVNRKDVVVGAVGVNEDGADLLEGYDYRKKDLDLVMDELVDRAIEMGYLHEGGKITLSLDADEEWVVSHSDHLTDQLDTYLADKITVTIDIEQKQEATAPAGTIVIPVDPDNYGESDYGDDDDGDSGYDASNDDDDDSDDDDDDSDDDEDDSDDDDGQTDYDTDDDDEDRKVSSSSDRDDDDEDESDEDEDDEDEEDEDDEDDDD